MRSGLGALGRAERRGILGETLSQVMFPGLQRFGIDVRGGEIWLAERMNPLQALAVATSSQE